MRKHKWRENATQTYFSIKTAYLMLNRKCWYVLEVDCFFYDGNKHRSTGFNPSFAYISKLVKFWN